MIGSLLVANRGEIAVRILRTARRMGLATVAVHSDADAGALHVAMADRAVRIGAAPAQGSYLDGAAIIAAAHATGAGAIHPGYGFLSENPAFAEAVAAAGLIFVGPPASAIRAMGLKDAAKALMERAGVPVVPGYHGADQSDAVLAAEAARIGWPVLIKAVAGGGGKGMRRVDGPDGFAAALAQARGEARSAFGNDAVLVERCVTSPRHIEVQVFADAHRAVHLNERDCSLQRRHQKVIEESPAPGMTPAMRAALGAAAVRAATAIGYRGAGTVEFIADASDGLSPDRCWFMEMNTRLQVEHPVTEAVTGLDLVEWQIRVAAGEDLPQAWDEPPLDGHAIECRLYAEDPAAGFLPSTGRITRLTLPGGIRADAGVREGDSVTPHYDPMIAKLVVHAADRAQAIAAMRRALAGTRIAGIASNAGFLDRLLAHPDFVAGTPDTGLIDRDLAALAAPPDPDPVLHAVAVLLAQRRHPGQDDVTLWAPLETTATLVGPSGTIGATVARQGGGYRVALPDGTAVIDAIAFDGDAIAVTAGGNTRHLWGVNVDGRITIHDGAERFDWTAPDPLARAGTGSAGGADTVTAPMPGLLKSVLVAPGDAVARGQPLAVIEAMKMELPVASPRDGRVAAIPQPAGTLVAMGATLVALAPAD